MKAFISKDAWLEGLNGWNITDCAIRSSTIVYLVARQELTDEEDEQADWDHDILTRFIVIYLDDNPEGGLGCQDLGGFSHPRCGVSCQPFSQGMVAARNRHGDVWVVGSGNEGGMEHISPAGDGPMTMRIKCIDGHAYSVGSGRKVYKRVNLNVWVKLDNGFEHAAAPANQRSLDSLLNHAMQEGFEDIDGFSETDIYAVGGHGDVWHFDGTTWMQEGFPSNMQLNTVTCAGDGYVYVSGQGGSLWRGRNSSWETLYEGASSIPWNDVLWFEDKLWLASDYQTRIWDGKSMQPITRSGYELPYSGHMDAYDGLLVIADTHSVVAYQNGDWRTLVAPYEDDDDN